MKFLSFTSILAFYFILNLAKATYAQTFTPSPDVLTQALSADSVRWKADPNTNPEYTTYNTLATVKAMNYLALVAYHNPSNTTVVNRLLVQIRSAIKGGYEPTCRGAILGWTDNALAQSLTLAKYTSTVWSKLTSAEKNKCDWLMKALTVAGNYNQNFHNNPARCILGVFQFGGKRTSPNIQEGYVGIMITAHKYFGGATAVNDTLAHFDYDRYLAAFTSLGFTNIIYGWTYNFGDTSSGRAQMGSRMENGGTDAGGGTIATQGVRRPFTFGDYSSPAVEIPYDPFQIYQALAARMYRHITHSQSDSGYAYILNNRISPMTGLMGMCNELQGLDGAGERSSVRYAYDGWMNSILTYATLRTLGLWGNTAAHQDIDRRMKVGSIDLLYKYKAGYQGRSNGESKRHTEPTGITLGYIFLKDIWTNYLWSRKDMNLLELMSPTVSESFNSVTLSSGFTNGTFTGAQGLTWNYTQARKGNGDQVKPDDNNIIALSATNNGNLRTTLTKPLKGLRFKVRARTASGSPAVTVRVNGTAVRTYTSFSSTEVEVVHVPNIYALTGQELMIDNTGTAEVLIDDVELEDAAVFVQLRNGNSSSPNTYQLRPHFRLTKQTTDTITYQSLTLRYWFTSENHNTLETFVDVASIGTGNVLMQDYALSPGRQGADRYMEYTFTSAAGMLPATGNSGSIETRIRKINQTIFNEADDYSYVSNTSFVQTNKVTVYRNGEIIWGKEPTASGARIATIDVEGVSTNWAIYPNPASEELMLSGGNPDQPIDVTIRGVNGHVLMKSHTYFQKPIGIEKLATGLYLLEVQQANTVKQLKFLKQ
ncbi:cellulose binding domain-containing protein [Spirosoma panaciterrae]|uniref:cellulose binding domain-containing protein n=1 Tax=Spirosoma panaciterrae TaxID=496058 RepID=UPI0003694949|nr:cellulose binding domain-containing protein [Spirosoma panaciterrae]